MKYLLLTTIAAVVLVGCSDPTILLPGGGKSIYRAASEGKTEDVKQYLASGMDVNAKDRDGNTSLIYAKTKEMVELLVTSVADVNVRDRKDFIAQGFGMGMGENSRIINHQRC